MEHSSPPAVPSRPLPSPALSLKQYEEGHRCQNPTSPLPLLVLSCCQHHSQANISQQTWQFFPQQAWHLLAAQPIFPSCLNCPWQDLKPRVCSSITHQSLDAHGQEGREKHAPSPGRYRPSSFIFFSMQPPRS